MEEVPKREVVPLVAAAMADEEAAMTLVDDNSS